MTDILKNVLIVVDDIEKSIEFYKDLFGLQVILKNEGNVILSEGLVLQDAGLWGKTLDETSTPFNNMMELYFEEFDIDGLIAALDKKIAKKRLIKQGAMQQLLTGKKRLPGFSDPWVEKKFSDLYRYASEGGTPDTNNMRFYANGDVPFVKIEDTETKYIESCNSFITSEGINNSSAWIVPVNSIIYTNGATIGNVSINKIPVATKQGILGIIPSSIINLEFMYYLLLSQNFKREVDSRQAKGTFATIILKSLDEIPIYLPLNQMEQIAIATILSDMDKEIADLEAQRDKYRLLKSGMMQKLLTGQIRLKIK